MTAGPFTEYASASLAVVNGSMTLGSAQFVMVLLSSAYVPNFAVDAAWSDVMANEIAPGVGYAAGGTALTEFAATVSNGALSISFANPTWTNFSGTFKYGVIVRRAGAMLVPSDLLLCAFDADPGGGSLTGNGEALTIQFAPAGVLAYMLGGLGVTYVTNLPGAVLSSSARLAVSQGGSDFTISLASLASYLGLAIHGQTVALPAGTLFDELGNPLRDEAGNVIVGTPT